LLVGIAIAIVAGMELRTHGHSPPHKRPLEGHAIAHCSGLSLRIRKTPRS
jgi:hypothetical protein